MLREYVDHLTKFLWCQKNKIDKLVLDEVGTRGCNQRLDPNGDPTRNPTRTGRGKAGRTFYRSGWFGAGL